MINLHPEVGNKNKNNLAILESLKLSDPSTTFELLTTQSQRSAFAGVHSLFNCRFDQLRTNISLLNRRERSLVRYLMIGDIQFITLISEIESEEQGRLYNRLRNNWLVITQPLIDIVEEPHLISSDSESSDGESSNNDSDQGWAPPAVILRLSDLHRDFHNV